MIQPSLTKAAQRQLAAIHRASSRYNTMLAKEHTRALLALVGAHAREIDELYRRKDSHYIIESGDLLVLCCELIMEAGASLDTVLDICYERYHRKLRALIAERRQGIRTRNKKRSRRV